MSPRESIQHSLLALCKMLRKNPFSILREAGLQAELRSLLLRDKWVVGKVPITIIEHKDSKSSKGGEWPRYERPQKLLENQLLRVQLEMKILGYHDTPSERDDRAASRVDLVMIKHASREPALPSGRARLICYPNGPGDLVATMDPEDIAAAIEIKASPSIDRKQRALFRKDIVRLLLLAEQERCKGIATFFLVVDKSQALFGAWIERPRVRTKMPVDWTDPQAVEGCNGLDLKSAGIRVTAEEPKNLPFVEIWSVSIATANPVLYAVRAKATNR